MSNSDSNRSIPLWQQQHSTPSPPSSDAKDPGSDADRSTLIQQASEFLKDQEIRDAPTDRKITFLESKGLTPSEIDSLLGVSRNTEASSSAAEENKSTSESNTEPPIQAPSTPDILPPSSKTTQSTSSAPRDVPPIITYPEFLLHQSKPPPLVTLRSVLYTLYGAAGLGATVYGASEYLVKPMLASLTDARHELADKAQENLKHLNELLEANVSQLPPSLLVSRAPTVADTDEDIESITSDPTELFHRDIGTQTSQELPQPPTTSASTADSEPNTPSTVVTNHQKRLEQIGTHLREFADAQSQSSTLNDTTRSRITDLQRYLDTLAYSKNSYPYSSTGYGAYSSPGFDSGNNTGTGMKKAEEDAISSFRAEIRGVKGALLSARNFPSGRGGGVRNVGSYVR
ncbi:peroxisomal membrane anchor protein conserved region-domain-containing protein [Aspergillus karnatakaensis]|uniref:peroxisomal membrane protein PEX14 n=1 Tax=Aspergillus karnatakaensis TaxID=1810916 RepID=UPI003CCDF916